MASVSKHGRKFSVRFRYAGIQHRVTVDSEAKAESVRLIVENTLTDLRLGRLSVPAGVDAAEFIASGGRVQRVPASPPLGTLVDGWKASTNAARTSKTVHQVHIGHLLAFFGSEPIDRLNLEGYVTHRGRTVAGTTIRKELITLSSILRHAEKTGHATCRSQIRSLDLPSDTQDRRFCGLSEATDGRCVLLTEQEVSELRKIVRKNGSTLIADAVDLVAFTGIRRSEVCRIQPEDVDLKRQRLTVRELKRKHGTMTFRTLPIHPEILPMLRRRVAKECDPVFTPSVNTLSSGFAQAIRNTRFDVTGFGFHVLRHSAASRLLSLGVPAVTVAGILGHASVSTTLGIYAHSFEADRVDAVNLL